MAFVKQQKERHVPPASPPLSSNDFPGHFAPGPPQSGELHLRFAFHPVMLFEAEDAAMRF
jgi:hypothetical protein